MKFFQLTKQARYKQQLEPDQQSDQLQHQQQPREEDSREPAMLPIKKQAELGAADHQTIPMHKDEDFKESDEEDDCLDDDEERETVMLDDEENPFGTPRALNGDQQAQAGGFPPVAAPATAMIDRRQQQQQDLRPIHKQTMGPTDGQQHQDSSSSAFLMDKNKKLFPQKLWELIHNPSIQHCLRWSQDGQRVYLNRNEFETYYLKTPSNQFHTQKAISFVRQMNMYGFRKVDDCYYENDNFRRGSQHLLRNMIRRHPNKSLFVGLDHHQLAAAAVAQQALQVNHHFQQQQHQQQHHQLHHHHQQQHLQQQQQQQQHHQQILDRFEQQQKQAMRLSSFLKGSQFPAVHQARSLHAQQQQQQQQQLQHQLKQHSSPYQTFEQQVSAHLSKQATAMNQQQHHQQQQHQQHGLSNQVTANYLPRKSRLLSEFYASMAANNNNGSESCLSPSMPPELATPSSGVNQLGGGLDLKTAREGSSQASSPELIQTASQASNSSQVAAANAAVAALRASLLHSAATGGHPGEPSGLQDLVSSFASTNQQLASQQQQQQFEQEMQEQHHQIQQLIPATDLSIGSRKTAASIQETLFRSLMQLKQQRQLNGAKYHSQGQPIGQQQQHQHSQSPSKLLLESLAHLSSAGSGSLADHTSESPSTSGHSPSRPTSAERLACDDTEDCALDLVQNRATSSDASRSTAALDIDVEATPGDEDDVADEDEHNLSTSSASSSASSNSLDGSRKKTARVVVVANKKKRKLSSDGRQRRFADFDDDDDDDDDHDDDDVDDDDDNRDGESSLNKRIRLLNAGSKSRKKYHHDQNGTISSISKSLITELCDRRGSKLDVAALQEAARYTECFLDMLLDGAALIGSRGSSRQSPPRGAQSGADVDEDNSVAESADSSGSSSSSHEHHHHDHRQKRFQASSNTTINISSLSMALKLVPSRLITAIQQE